MEILLAIMGVLFALGFLFEKGSEFIKQLKSGSVKLSKGFEARLSFAPIDNKKSEASSQEAYSTNENFD